MTARPPRLPRGLVRGGKGGREGGREGREGRGQQVVRPGYTVTTTRFSIVTKPGRIYQRRPGGSRGGTDFRQEVKHQGEGPTGWEVLISSVDTGECSNVPMLECCHIVLLDCAVVPVMLGREARWRGLERPHPAQPRLWTSRALNRDVAPHS